MSVAISLNDPVPDKLTSLYATSNLGKNMVCDSLPKNLIVPNIDPFIS